MNSHLLHLFIICFLFVNNVLSYGYTGHEITATIAQKFLTPKARENVKELLPREAHGNLYLIASWADKIKYRPEYRFTSRMHYVNSPQDKPPDNCSITYTPSKVNLLKAIHNYTDRLDPKNNLDFSFRAEALKFLVHFIGDLHQPLHASTRQSGGNRASAIFEGHKTSLHYIWDSRLIYKHIRELDSNLTFSDEKNDITNNLYDGPFYEQYVNYIIKLMKSVWKQEMLEWIVCDEEYTFEKESQNSLKQTHFGSNLRLEEKISLKKKSFSASCPEFWAIPLNRLNCEIVWKDYKPDTELSEGVYYERIKQTRIVEKLLAIAGIRIAAVLNTLLG